MLCSSAACDASPLTHPFPTQIDALADGIKAFNGGVVIVSHDARLIVEAGCEMWVCGNETVTPFDGDFEDYRDMLLEELAEEERRQDLEAAERATKRAEKRKQIQAEKVSVFVAMCRGVRG